MALNLGLASSLKQGLCHQTPLCIPRCPPELATRDGAGPGPASAVLCPQHRPVTLSTTSSGASGALLRHEQQHLIFMRCLRQTF